MRNSNFILGTFLCNYYLAVSNASAHTIWFLIIHPCYLDVPLILQSKCFQCIGALFVFGGVAFRWWLLCRCIGMHQPIGGRGLLRLQYVGWPIVGVANIYHVFVKVVVASMLVEVWIHFESGCSKCIKAGFFLNVTLIVLMLWKGKKCKIYNHDHNGNLYTIMWWYQFL